MKQTSIKAYKEIREDGTLTMLQDMVYTYVKEYQPVFGREVSEVITGGHKRLSDLEKMGLVRTSKEPMFDDVTGHYAYMWELGKSTTHKPKKLSREDLVDHIKYLQERIDKTHFMMSEISDAAYRQGVADVIAGRVPGGEMEEE